MLTPLHERHISFLFSASHGLTFPGNSVNDMRAHTPNPSFKVSSLLCSLQGPVFPSLDEQSKDTEMTPSRRPRNSDKNQNQTILSSSKHKETDLGAQELGTLNQILCTNQFISLNVPGSDDWDGMGWGEECTSLVLLESSSSTSSSQANECLGLLRGGLAGSLLPQTVPKHGPDEYLISFYLFRYFFYFFQDRVSLMTLADLELML